MKFNIQHFANEVQTSEILTTEMKTFYDMTLIDEASANLVHDQFGQRRPIPANGGKIIEFRKFSPLAKATTPLTEGVTPDGKKLSVSTVTGTVAQYGDYITQSDVLELTALDNTILESAKLLGRQAGATLDTVVRNVLQSGTNVMYADKVSGGSVTEITSRAALDEYCPITVELIQRAAAKLRAMNTKAFADNKYVAIIHPFAAYDLMRDSEWVDAHKYASPENLYEGEIGEIAGVRFVQSSEAKVYCGADLASDTRTLKVNAENGLSAATTVPFDGSTAGVGADALKGRYVIINGTKTKITGNTASQLTVATAVTCSDNADIYPGEGGADGLAVFSTLILGENAYGVTEVNGGGLEIIVKQRGSAGSADPLDQRSSVGWKALKTAEILVENNMIRIESVSPKFSATEKEN